MARLYCSVSEGLRKAEATVTVSEYDGTSQHFPLDRGLITKAGGRSAIPVGVIQYAGDAEGGEMALVSLPVEADSGTQRIWVRPSDLVGEKAGVRTTSRRNHARDSGERSSWTKNRLSLFRRDREGRSQMSLAGNGPGRLCSARSIS